MRYDMTTPCPECPFLIGSGFTWESLVEHASGEFACHKACEVNEEGFYRAKDVQTPHCAGALIFNEKREVAGTGTSTQMMRISERLGLYDRTKLNMAAPVGSQPSDYQRPRRLRRQMRKGRV